MCMVLCGAGTEMSVCVYVYDSVCLCIYVRSCISVCAYVCYGRWCEV